MEEIKEKKERNILQDTKVPYNIISNISLNKYNPISPNQRQKNSEYDIKQKQITTIYKDYNIIISYW